MDLDTIQTDVPQVTTDEATSSNQDTAPKEAQKTPRELEMERIEARHQAQMAEENGFTLEAEPEPNTPPAAAATAPTADDQLSAQLGDPPTDTAPSATPPKVKVKVDGVESEVPFDEVVRNYQKTAAADRKLAEAARLQREAAEMQARIAEQQAQLQAQLQQQPPQQAQQDNNPDPVEPDESGKAFLKALFEGDEETALAKLTELTAKGRQQVQTAQPTLDVDQLAQQVTQHVQQKLVVESALAQHRKDYPQIYADPDMEGFVLTKVNSLRRETNMDFFDALNSVSKDFATKFGWTRQEDQGRPSEPVQTTNSRVTKLERKAQIDNVSSVNTKNVTAETTPELASDIIAQMRKQRGG